GAAVFKDEFKIEAEEGVKKVAEEKEVDYYARFEITVNVSELKGTNELTFLVKNGDGVYTIYTDSNIEVSLDFLQEGTEEEPTATPDTGAKNEPVLVRFNDSDAAEEFFLYSTNNSHVNAIDFDEDKQCVVIKCSAGEDPNLLFPFGSLALDGNLGFDYYNTEDYKAMVIIGRFDYDSVMFDPATKVSGTFYFTTDEDSTFSETKNLKYQYDRSDELQYIVLNFAKSRFWKGSITDCRFDFFERTEQDCEYEIYFFGLFENVDEANSFVAAYKEGGDSVLPTPEPTPEPTPTPEVTAAPEVTEAPAVTDAPKATDATKATEEPAQNKGCGGFVAAIPAGVLTLAAALALNKKKRR
ncbi:MAG: hypothetical protein J6112_08075, partial [Clostridia bacterium]|nr:hypothetical protein [Clostridia bacterium]